jgi:hypothetical protein
MHVFHKLYLEGLLACDLYEAPSEPSGDQLESGMDGQSLTCILVESVE